MLAQLQADFKAMLMGQSVPPLFVETTVTAQQSAAIYQHNYQEIHIAALKDTYSTVYHLTGEAYFRQLAKRYLQQHPSISGDLNHYGEHFADFIDILLQKIPNDLPYLADVARFDWAYFTVLMAHYQGENGFNQLATWSMSQQAQSRAVPHPVSQLMYSPYPIWQIWQLSLGAIKQVDLDTGAEYLLISRPLQQVAVNVLSKQAYDFLQAWFGGHSLADAINTTFSEHDSHQLPTLFNNLHQWAAIVELRSS